MKCKKENVLQSVQSDHKLAQLMTKPGGNHYLYDVIINQMFHDRKYKLYVYVTVNISNQILNEIIKTFRKYVSILIISVNTHNFYWP